jgi:hypothetical protein
MILKSAGKIVYLPLPNLACLASWRELFPVFECDRVTGKFAQAAKIFKHSNAKFAKMFTSESFALLYVS